MSTVQKPRFHDEECFGADNQSTLSPARISGCSSVKARPQPSADLIQSAQIHFENRNFDAAVDDIISAYKGLAEDRARLTVLRNQAFRDLSTSQGWQSAPHPQALRLRRLTPSIPLRSTLTESPT